ncbi:CLUMA_CG003611, isoform A [Clunio marinus]|uniref:CLUMA_CG003611, isoform A n=1 Tax=Clunio marinus TaxID=568069 RepID=A0A1J1HP92_9DIPT|nr:CLUMA_CG003611, isoform A [Clunio marinus]
MQSSVMLAQYGMLVKRTKTSGKSLKPVVEEQKIDNFGSFNVFTYTKKFLNEPAGRINANVPKHATNDTPKSNLVMKIKKTGNGHWKDLVHESDVKKWRGKRIATKEAISPPINNTKLPDHAFEKPNGIPSNNIISISTYNSPIRNASEENQNMENHPN